MSRRKQRRKRQRFRRRQQPEPRPPWGRFFLGLLLLAAAAFFGYRAFGPGAAGPDPTAEPPVAAGPRPASPATPTPGVADRSPAPTPTPAPTAAPAVATGIPHLNIRSDLLAPGRVAAFARTPAGDRIALAAATGVYLLDAASLALADHLPTAAPVLDLAILPGATGERANVVALTAAGRVNRWPLPAGDRAPAARSLQQAPGPLRAASLAPGATLAATLGGSARTGAEIRIYDTVSGELLHILSAHGGRAEALHFLPDPDRPTLLTRGNDGRVRLWQGPAWEEVPLPAALAGGVSALATGRDPESGSPLLAAGAADGTLSLWDARTWRRLLAASAPGDGPLSALALSPGATRLSALRADGSLTLWEIAGGERLRTCPAAAGRLAFIRRGRAAARLLTLDEDGRLRTWATAGGPCPERPLAASDPNRPFLDRLDFLAGGPAGALAAAGQNGHIFVWDPDAGAVTRILDPGGPVGALAYGGDGLLAAGGVAGVRLWQTSTGVLRHELGGHVATHPDTANVRALAFSPAPAGETAGILASADRSGLLKLWRTADGAMLRNVVPPEEAPITSLAFTPDGYHLLVGSGATVAVWQPRRSQLVRVLGAGGEAVAAPAPSPASQAEWERIAVLRGARVDLYDEEGRRLRALQAVPAGPDARAATVTAAAFLRLPGDGGALRLATGHDDGSLRLWDPAQGLVVAMPAPHPRAVTALAADGCRLISAGSAGTLRVDDLCPSR